MALRNLTLLFSFGRSRLSSTMTHVSPSVSRLYSIQPTVVSKSVLTDIKIPMIKIARRPLFTSNLAQRDHVYSIYGMHLPPNVKIESEQDALEIVYYLRQSERDLLYNVLQKHQSTPTPAAGETTEINTVSAEHIKLLFLSNTLPFIGFGVLDNLIMILAGEYIDSTFGIVLGLSTMAAAGFGNIISDIAGIGCAHYVEFAVAKFGFRPPVLTAQQWDSGRARWATNGGRAFGLTVGCLIGMFPLLFFDEKETQEKKLQARGAAA